ncbi:MAG: hypothetical protein N4A45_13740 [Flavobacteriales bacterium]|jgi:uncharacterized membrane protein|nr:hypothetical protein [Flavobacteriales bacterium]
MEDYVLARVIHILAVVIWIGGVFMVTVILLPAINKMKEGSKKLETFEMIEGRFAFFAKITTILTAISGFYMVHILDAWNRFLDPTYWWMHAMVFVWLIFSFILFIAEPFIVAKKLKELTEKYPEKTFVIMQRVHWILLSISMITIFGATAGSHGWFLF